MKNFMLIGLFLSLSAFSQVKTGGGEPFTEDYEGGATVNVNPLDTQMRKFMVHLKKQERSCTSGNRMIGDPDIMQVYLTLSVFKNGKYSNDQCENVNKFLTCLNDQTTISISAALKTNPKIPGHLAKKYKIDLEQASEMMKFFSTLGDKIQ